MPILTAVRRIAITESQENAFEKLARQSHKSAYHFAYRLTGSAVEAEDLLQESLIRAYRFFHRYDASLPFSSWLYRIMMNAHIDLVRRKGRIKTTPLDGHGENNSSWDISDSAHSPDEMMMKGSMEEPLQKGLLSMTSEFRTAVLLADVEGLSYDEIAEIMGTSVGTVRSRIHRGRKQLRAYLLKNSPETYGVA